MKYILAQGAEAIILKKKESVIKQRLKKTYRLPQLDERLRSQRTKKEARLLGKAAQVIPVPKLLETSLEKKELHMQALKGKPLALILDNQKNKKAICTQIGKNIALLHDESIIHGDLTTSNMIFADKKVYFIDFGLGFESNNVEDKAVDLHVLKEALQARHYKSADTYWQIIEKAYASTSHQAQKTLQRLAQVEKRGRYKAQI